MIRLVSSPVSLLAFFTLGIRAVRLAFAQQRVFNGALRAIHRAESAGERSPTGIDVTSIPFLATAG